jgi:hypothetical protein
MVLSQLTFEKPKWIPKSFWQMENVRYRGVGEIDLEFGAGDVHFENLCHHLYVSYENPK